MLGAQRVRAHATRREERLERARGRAAQFVSSIDCRMPPDHPYPTPLPAAVVLDTGAFDLTASGDSLQTNLGIDQILTVDFAPVMPLHAGDEDLRRPSVSPLFADLVGFPPTIPTAGTRDLLLSETVRMHRALRAAGVNAELHVWEAGSHGLFVNSAPEDVEKAAEIRRFVGQRCPAE